MPESRIQIAAVVVLYQPGPDVLDNIKSYSDQVDAIYAVDNSPEPALTDVGALQSFAKLVYINNHGNQGIAHALNRGAEIAMANAYTVLLTMDQDTALPTDYIQTLLRDLASNSDKRIGIITARHFKAPPQGAPAMESVMITMTSGNILNLSAFLETGPFLEDLFIDHVDHEYCLRLKTYDYQIMQCNRITLPHRPGKELSIRVLFRTWTFSTHTPIRLYYFCRNGFWVSKLYRDRFPNFVATFRRQLVKECIKILFEPQSVLRFRMVVRAIRDYRKGRLGPFEGGK